MSRSSTSFTSSSPSSPNAETARGRAHTRGGSRIGAASIGVGGVKGVGEAAGVALAFPAPPPLPVAMARSARILPTPMPRSIPAIDLHERQGVRNGQNLSGANEREEKEGANDRGGDEGEDDEGGAVVVAEVVPDEEVANPEEDEEPVAELFPVVVADAPAEECGLASDAGSVVTGMLVPGMPVPFGS